MQQFLESITYREAWLSLEATAPGDLPPYIGSIIRGALGHLVRPLLCDGSGCGHTCQKPTSCRYYSLFEKSRTADGRNAAKALIVEPPVLPELESIALGGPVRRPFQTRAPRAGECLPDLLNDHLLGVEPGGVLNVGIRLLGAGAAALPAIIDEIGRQGFDLHGVPFLLRTARDSAGRLLYDRRIPRVPAQFPAPMHLTSEPERARRIRLVFETPTVYKLADSPTFQPADFGLRFWGHALARAVQVHDSLMDKPALGWIEPPPIECRIVGHRLFRYVLPRRSYTQDRRLNFDGVIGHIDLEGNLDAAMPFARAAEILHFGQKAAFGLGRVRVLVLE